MMRSLTGLLSAYEISEIREKTAIKINNADKFVTPEALLLYEQSILDDVTLLNACRQEYGKLLFTPKVSYVPKDILEMFRKYDVVVISYDVETHTVLLGILPEFADQAILIDRYSVRKTLVPIYYYVQWRTCQFGKPDFVNDLPVKDLWGLIVHEAIKLDASDITVSSANEGASVYYNVRKTKVRSRRVLQKKDIEEIVKLIATSAKATLADMTAKPRYFAIDLDKRHRGRVVVNKTIDGMLITIRVLCNDSMSKSLEELHITPPVAEFIRTTMLSTEKGLRLFIGETMSGKNTTILSAINELVVTDKYKIVSVEQPVEIRVDGMEQINAETDDEFAANADSLLRQNPDYVYFTEVTARTADAVMQQSNTAKAVFSTIHANSISDVLFRLHDITGMPMDRLLLTMHSCVYQELRRDDLRDTVLPYNRCIYFSDALKMKLYGQDTATIKSVLIAIEKEWDDVQNREYWG